MTDAIPVRVWATDDEDEQHGAVVVLRRADVVGGAICASDAEDAAADYAERKFDGADPFEDIEISVRMDDGSVVAVTVDVDWSPNFYAHAEAK